MIRSYLSRRLYRLLFASSPYSPCAAARPSSPSRAFTPWRRRARTALAVKLFIPAMFFATARRPHRPTHPPRAPAPSGASWWALSSSRMAPTCPRDSCRASTRRSLVGGCSISCTRCSSRMQSAELAPELPSAHASYAIRFRSVSAPRPVPFAFLVCTYALIPDPSRSLVALESLQYIQESKCSHSRQTGPDKAL